jgi:hypothetical protein
MRTQVLALYDAWDGFPAADMTSLRPGDPTMEDQFVANLIELLSEQLTHGQEAAKTAP